MIKKRSKHSLSNYKLLSANQGLLFPINCTEVLPGDTIQQKTSALIRVAPLVTPVMHPVHVRIHHFFVPNRLVWDDWEDFITGGDYGSTPPVYPTVTLDGDDPLTGSALGGLADYLGIKPCQTGETKTVSALPFRAYNLIYNEWYRDQDIDPAVAVSTTSGADTTTNMLIKQACWGKDYFTTLRPWAQKGGEIMIPTSSTMDIDSDGTAIEMSNLQSPGNRNIQVDNTAVKNVSLTGAQYGTGGNLAFGSNTGLEGDIAGAMGSINDLRLAFGLQAYSEARALYGSRYTEYLRYLGVTPSDARLQRPEYLGGGRETIQFSEVLQTAEGTDPVATMRGHGIAGLGTNRYRKFFEEHGFLISLISVLPVPVYNDAVERHWLKRTKEEFFQKELQHIGLQEVMNYEVDFKGANQASPTVFGYGMRYDEYRRQLSTVAGEFRDTLKDWHMARFFSSTPALNATFIDANPTNRIYAATSADQLYIMAHNSIQARRIISQVGRPKVL